MIANDHPRQFVPASFDPADWASALPVYQQLLDRKLESLVDAEKYLRDFSELTSVMDEYGARRYIEKSCHTDDEAIKARFMHFVEEIEPRIKPIYFELQKKIVQSPLINQLREKKHTILLKKWKADIDIFRPENVALETRITKLVTDYDTLSGDMMVTFDGREQTLQQMGRYLEMPDREQREKAWRLTAERRHQDHEKFDDIFDELLALRSQIAGNVGMNSYRDYSWQSYKRFDYTPEQCLGFADAIEKTVVPLVRQLDQNRQNELKLPALRPWDTAVDPKNRPALAPFDQSDIAGLIDKTKAVLHRISPALADDFESLRANSNLDLDSRKGKQPGGYQSTLDESRQPFIFMNAAGLQRDVEVLLHEGGHAFHAIAARDEELVFLRSAPMEFCEVASMSMELLGSDHFDLFYDAAGAARAKRTMLENIIKFLPWMATIDCFQHWLYSNPGHTRDQRTAHWLSLLDRFSSRLDWTGLEHFRAASWQKQLHLYHVPFYYIEYGIAQLGALQLWVKSRTDGHRALANYRAALKLGGTRSLPELFAAAGIVFDFSQRTLGPLMDAIATELAQLPRD